MDNRILKLYQVHHYGFSEHQFKIDDYHNGIEDIVYDSVRQCHDFLDNNNHDYEIQSYRFKPFINADVPFGYNKDGNYYLVRILRNKNSPEIDMRLCPEWMREFENVNWFESVVLVSMYQVENTLQYRAGYTYIKKYDIDGKEIPCNENLTNNQK